jgi:hypothetical protein
MEPIHIKIDIFLLLECDKLTIFSLIHYYLMTFFILFVKFKD